MWNITNLSAPLFGVFLPASLEVSESYKRSKCVLIQKATNQAGDYTKIGAESSGKFIAI